MILGLNFFKLFIYLSMSSLGLCGFARASFSCCKWALLFSGVHRLFTVVASLVQSTGSRSTGLGVGPRNVKSSQTRDQTCVQMDSYPLYHQGSPWGSIFNHVFSRVRDFKASLIFLCVWPCWVHGWHASSLSLITILNYFALKLSQIWSVEAPSRWFVRPCDMFLNTISIFAIMRCFKLFFF